MVIPVFYGLDPSHVRKQTGDFGKIFEKTCQNKTEEEITQWRRALTDVANTLGYHSFIWKNEAELVEEIVSDVLEKLLLTPPKDSEDFVGIEDHIAKLSVLLQLEAEEVRMVGLWGSSGIGKTTIARVLFNRLSRHFQGSTFIDRAFISKSIEVFSRANPGDYNMKLHLQRNFLSEILGKGDIKINHLSAVEERLKHHRVLIFVDDLDDQVVLDALIGKTQWFGSGSRIVVVTNDKHFLRSHGIDHIYEVCLPSEHLAQQMLCRSAFREKFPPEGFKELVVEVTRLAGSLPLGLNVLGSSLRGRDIEYWMDLLPSLRNGIEGKIEKTLRVSYDGLSSKSDKAIFRHIACLFNGAEITYLKLLLGDSGLSVNVGLENLVDKSLIHVSRGHVWMHRLLEEMGRSIVRLEEPEKREFLMDSQDIFDVLSEGTGTRKILGISLDTDEIGELYLHENAFTGMRNLLFLIIYSKDRAKKEGDREVKLQLSEKFVYLSPKLKLLRWDECPMRCLPSKFRPENLVKLQMENSKLEKLWEGVVPLPCLKEMNLRDSYDLVEMPDLSTATNLETLNLVGCYSLVKLPSSIPYPNKLTEINMCGCRNLEIIPTGINLRSLKDLRLVNCSRLRTFPLISTNISTLLVDVTAIEEFPLNSNLRFENLCSFDMKSLKSEKRWEGVQQLTLLTAMLSPSLKHLSLSDISGLVELPSSFQNLHQLEQLEIENCENLETLPSGINLQSLWYLDLSGCSRLRTFPDISTKIKELYLRKTGIEEVPCWIGKLYGLKFLRMNGCNKLESVHLNIFKLKNLREVDFSYCKALTRASWSYCPSRGRNTFYGRLDINIYCTKCLNLDQEALFQQKTHSVCQLRLSGEEVPSYFTHRTFGTSSSLPNIPLLPGSLKQSFLRFRVCLVSNCDKTIASFRFKGRFWNSFSSSGQAQDFRANTEVYAVKTSVKESHLFVLDCGIPLSRDSDILAEMNYTHVDLQLDFTERSSSSLKLKEWGIRLLEKNPLGNRDSNDVTEGSSKRMRIS